MGQSATIYGGPSTNAAGTGIDLRNRKVSGSEWIIGNYSAVSWVMLAQLVN